MKPTGAYGESLESGAITWSSSNPDDWEYSVSGNSIGDGKGWIPFLEQKTGNIYYIGGKKANA